jgi:hypothetical protein
MSKNKPEWKWWKVFGYVSDVKWFVRKNHNQRLFQEQKLCG